jgi:cellulose synthase/poly-beta-1,6-N-acetylglucosamine synthase-like glycosyltransferase
VPTTLNLCRLLRCPALVVQRRTTESRDALGARACKRHRRRAQRARKARAATASVIVPTRNESDNVRPLVALLDGVLAQHDIEVIFVDDSDDGTHAVVREMVPADNRDTS